MPQTTSRNRNSNLMEEDIWSRPIWPPHLEKELVELVELVEMKYNLDVCVSGFNEQAWDHVCQEFNKETGLNYDKMELKKQVSFLRKRYRIMKPLYYNHGGFGWDYRRKMVDVDDGVWAENIEVYPEIIPSRKWGCPLYDDFMHHIYQTIGYRRVCNFFFTNRSSLFLSP